MTAPVRHPLPQLPLGDIPSTPPKPRDVAEGETPDYGDQYRRLFGDLAPAQVIQHVPPPALCDPSQAAGHHLPPLDAIAQLRTRHRAKGFTTAKDAAHGSVWFWHGVHEFWWRAMDAGPDREARRKHKIAAAALIVASIEADDFLTQLQEPAAHE